MADDTVEIKEESITVTDEIGDQLKMGVGTSCVVLQIFECDADAGELIIIDRHTAIDFFRRALAMLEGGE